MWVNEQQKWVTEQQVWVMITAGEIIIFRYI